MQSCEGSRRLHFFNNTILFSAYNYYPVFLYKIQLRTGFLLQYLHNISEDSIYSSEVLSNYNTSFFSSVTKLLYLSLVLQSIHCNYYSQNKLKSTQLQFIYCNTFIGVELIMQKIKQDISLGNNIRTLRKQSHFTQEQNSRPYAITRH